MAKVSGIQRAVAEFSGSPSALANAVGGKVLRQNVEYWLKVGRAPAEHCPAIEKAVAGKVRCEDLNPDVDWSYLRGTAAA